MMWLKIASLVSASSPDIVEHLRGKARWIGRASLPEQDEVKTTEQMFRMVWKAVRELYEAKIVYDAFIDRMSDIIPQQLRKAWNAGMRANGLDPARDQTPEWEAVFIEFVVGQFEHVDRFAADIVAARVAQSGTAGLRMRANMWANRYNECRDLATLTTARREDNLIWVLGEAEHCPTCLAIAGTVAGRDDWEIARDAGLFPKSGKLKCKGFNCKCRLEKTKQRKSPRALDAIITIALEMQE